MKLKIILAGAIFCAMVAAPAHAVTKCVALNSSTTCTLSDPSVFQNKSNWELNCTTNGKTVSVKGVWICGANRGDSHIAQAEITTSATDNKYCWCKMTSPAVSQWIYVDAKPSLDSCLSSCPISCASYTAWTPEFRNLLFSTLSD